MEIKKEPTIKKHLRQIKTMKDVKSFINDLGKLGLSDSFSPDIDFADYLDKHGEDLFSDQEVAELNIIMNDCIKVCKRSTEDIYRISLEQLKPKRAQDIKKAFDKEIKKGFGLSESLENLLNKKMISQSQDYFNWKHVKDLRKVNSLLDGVKKLLGRQ